MTKLMVRAVDLIGVRQTALDMAEAAPVATALFARFLFGVSIFVALVTVPDILDASPLDMAWGLLLLSATSMLFVMAWAMLGAAKEVQCRRNGMPVNPW